MKTETPPLAARVISWLATLGLMIVLLGFLAPVVLMIEHALAVEQAERLWEETLAKEEAKTRKAIDSFNRAVRKNREAEKQGAR